MFFSRFFKGLALSMGLAFLLGVITTQGALAQSEVECDCADYETAFVEARQALQIEESLYAQVLVTKDVGALLEYLSTGNLETAYENFIMAKANLQGCEMRVEEAKELCSGTWLSDTERTLIDNASGRVSFYGAMTMEMLVDMILDDLAVPDHQAEIMVDSSLSFDENVQLVMEYMMNEYGFADLVGADLIIKAMERAADLFVNVQVLVNDPAIDKACPDCSRLRAQVAAKKQELTAAQARLSDALTRQGAAVDALSQYDADLNTAISSSCKVVADYKLETVGNGQAAGIIMGVHFYCESEAQIETMLDNIEAFKRTHQKKTDLEETLRKANADVLVARKDVARLTGELKRLETALAECMKKKNALPECANAGDASGADREPLMERETGDTSTELEVKTTFTYAPTAIATVVEYRQQNNERLRLLNEQFNQKFDSFQDRVNTSGFSDYTRLDTTARQAVEYLTNRIPLFQGEDGGKRFGEDEVLTRAVVAEILYRLAQLGEIDYDVDVETVDRPEDVSVGVWFDMSVRAAIKNGVFIPQNNKVRPGDNVNWAELVTILRRFFGLEAINPDEPSFRNVNANEWYTGEFETLVEAGVLTRGEFALDMHPWENLTKMQFTRLLFNALRNDASFGG